MKFKKDKLGEACLESTTAKQLTKKNIETIAQLIAYTKNGRTFSDKVADAVTKFCGSSVFLYVHVLWFGFWMTFNQTGFVPDQWKFDPFPYEFLTFVVSLEAIFLSTFVLISQNRQNKMSDRQHHLDLQINMLAEQENSKMLCMLGAISQKLGISYNDPEITALEESTDADKLAKQIDEILDKEEEVPQDSKSALSH